MKISKENATEYEWGNKCQGWHLLNTETLSIIQERMPPSTSETPHKHVQSQQFFYILIGQATFEIADERIIVSTGEGVHIKPDIFHNIRNETQEGIEFLVISEPHAHGDRVLK